MVEWSITAVLKTAVLRGTGGSNPSLSAKPMKEVKKLASFFVDLQRGFLSDHLSCPAIGQDLYEHTFCLAVCQSAA